MIGTTSEMLELESELFKVVRNNDREEVVRILGLGLNINIQDNLGRTPIFLAALYNKLPIVKKLIELGADPKINDHMGNTVLGNMLLRRRPGDMKTQVSQKERLSTVKLLIKSGVDLTTRIRICGSLPIHMAIKARLGLRLIEELLTEDNVNAQDNNGYTPLCLAVSLGQINIVKLLLKYEQIDINIGKSYEATPLLLALKNNYVNIAVLLLFYGATPGQVFSDNVFSSLLPHPMPLVMQSIGYILSEGEDLLFRSERIYSPYQKYLLGLCEEYIKNKFIPSKPNAFFKLVSELLSSQSTATEQHQNKKRKILSTITNRVVISRLHITSSIYSPGPEMYEALRCRMLNVTTPRSVISEPPRPCSITSVSTSFPGSSLSDASYLRMDVGSPGSSLSEASHLRMDVDSPGSSLSDVSHLRMLDVGSPGSSISDVSHLRMDVGSPGSSLSDASQHSTSAILGSPKSSLAGSFENQFEKSLNLGIDLFSSSESYAKNAKRRKFY
ncbi:ankyrin repeat domain-containing protein [Candidatus Mesenet endosymbiont of Agriotes lineatus]|uniref:ankyrin repeat domain-containing protein n=1 Tax=Candidatus Mesenet endosymbiont of Agriotes lineatus TaxID=3077948 RepID=UPI0030CDF4B0